MKDPITHICNGVRPNNFATEARKVGFVVIRESLLPSMVNGDMRQYHGYIDVPDSPYDGFAGYFSPWYRAGKFQAFEWHRAGMAKDHEIADLPERLRTKQTPTAQQIIEALR